MKARAVSLGTSLLIDLPSDKNSTAMALTPLVCRAGDLLANAVLKHGRRSRLNVVGFAATCSI
jgi:hypothetical protein